MRRLFIDIETSPNIGFFWRPGFKVKIGHDNIIQERAVICSCWKWEGEKKIYDSRWRDGDDTNAIAESIQAMTEADEIVAHNGDRFDIPWLNTRSLMLGFGPVPQWKTVDTCKIAKKHFYFNSNKLDYLSKILLGEGKDETTYDMWIDICLKNCKKSMDKMVKYCKKDVGLLERVYQKLVPYTTPKTHVGALYGEERWTCPWTGSDNVIKSKTRTTSRGTVQHQMQSKETGGYYTISNVAYEQYCEEKGR